MTLDIDTVFRDSKIKGDPHSGANDPDKAEVRSLLKQIRDGSGQAVTRNTLSALNGVTPPNENYMGIVLTGPEAGYYSRSGGAWVFGRPFPDTIAGVTLSGNGTAQVGTLNPGVNPASVLVYFAEVTTPNTGPLKLTIDGVQRDVLNAAGNPLSPGEWVGGVQFRINPAGKFQLINEAGAAVVAAGSATFADERADDADAAALRAENAASSFSEVGTNFKTVPILLADETMGYAGSGADIEVGEGDIITAQGFRYEVAASGASDHHIETAGGVKLYALQPADGAWNVMAFGATPSAPDASEAFTKALGLATGHGWVNAPDTFRAGGVQLTSQNLRGKRLIRADGFTEILKLGSRSPGWDYCKISDIQFQGADDDSDLADAGVGVSITDDTDAYLAGRWTLDNAFFRYFDRAIVKNHGGIGNFYNQTSFRDCNVGFYAVATLTPGWMHPGCDVFNGGEHSLCRQAAFYIDDLGFGAGQTVFNQNVIETNYGFGVFVKSYEGILTFNQVWIEANASDPTPVTMPDNQTYDPRDVYLENVNLAEFNGTSPWKMTFVNSGVVFNNVEMGISFTDIINESSNVIARNVTTKALFDQPVVIESYVKAMQLAGGSADRVLMPPRTAPVVRAPFRGEVACNEAHDDPAGGSFSGSGSIPWVSVERGLTSDRCAEFTLAPEDIAFVGSIDVPHFAFAVYSVEVELLSGEAPYMLFTGNQTLCGDFGPLIRETNRFYTVGGIAQAGGNINCVLWIQNNSEEPISMRLGRVQVVNFGSMQDAAAFYNGRYHIR